MKVEETNVETQRMNLNLFLTKYLISKHYFVADNFSLIDVGASGGIDSYWHIFLPDQIIAFGFEPLVKEVERLNHESPSSKIKYLSYFVTSPHAIEMDQESLRRNNNPFPRTSAIRAQSVMSMDYARTFYDPSGSGEVISDYITLDDFCRQNGRLNVDFIKIDTDGMDFAVLLGSERLLSDRVLAVGIECNFHGPAHEKANLFSNIDGFLRNSGFTLFDIDIHRYSRSSLPKPFLYSIPAQTQSGQVMWGDALYLRDAAALGYEKIWNINLSIIKILKLASLFELFGLEDCAAELLIVYRDRIKASVDVEHCLNLLTPKLHGEQLTFKDYNLQFDQNIDTFFPEYASHAKRLSAKKRIVSFGLKKRGLLKKIPFLNEVAKRIYHRMIDF